MRNTHLNRFISFQSFSSTVTVRTSPEPDYDKPYDENRKQSSGTDESQFSDRSEQESYDRSAQRGNLYYNESTGTDQNSTDGYYDWDEEEAFREPDIVEAMRKFQGHQALQSIMYDTGKHVWNDIQETPQKTARSFVPIDVQYVLR